MAHEIKLPQFGAKKEDERKEIIQAISTDLDGLEAYATVLKMDGLEDNRNLKGIGVQIQAIREKLEKL